MAKVKVEVQFNLDDYFSKYGFGDGDDGAATDLGYQYRDAVVDGLNNTFKKYDLPLRVEADDACSIHNNCRIAAFITRLNDKGEEGYADLEDGDCPELGNAERMRLKIALAEVEAWLDKAVK